MAADVRPTPKISTLSRNGSRQPQLMNCSCGNCCANMKTPDDSTKPPATPSWLNDE